MKKVWLLLLLLVVFGTGCSPEATPPAATSTPIPATERPESSLTPTLEIIHTSFPGEFVLSPLQRIFDCSTGRKVSGDQGLELSVHCDQWDNNYFERPVDENVVDYSPQLDITIGEFGQDGDWFYARIFVFSEGIDPPVLDGIYALELDLNLDARGDILITAAVPSNNTPEVWSEKGVQVWFDKNDDVGGPQAMQIDLGFTGDGYEELLFDQGLGEDPDLAWVKISLETPGLVEFAFKRDLLAGSEEFEWWMWAMKDNLGAGKFDPNDFFPTNSVFNLDNTCGWIFGGYARDLPNICNTISGPKPTAEPGICQPPPGTCNNPCEYWDVDKCTCICFN